MEANFLRVIFTGKSFHRGEYSQGGIFIGANFLGGNSLGVNFLGGGGVFPDTVKLPSIVSG